METDLEGNLRSQDNEGYWQAVLQQGYLATPPSSPPPSTAWPATSGLSVGKTTTWDNGARSEEGSTPQNGMKEWQSLEEHYNQGDLLQLTVEGCNRGGLLVQCHGIMGFVPASQLVVVTEDRIRAGRDSYLNGRVGEVLALKIIELDPESKQVILSERAAKWEGKCPDKILQSIKPGDVYKGRVSNLCDFGAFVDLGGVDGLIHVSELSWNRVDHPRDLLKPGQEVTVHVMDVDFHRKRVALSLKRLRPDPWAGVEERYHVGQLVSGTVTNVVDFGAFVQIENGLEGLVHISELAEGNFLHPRNVVQEEEVITTRILHIDSAAHRLGLSLRRVYDQSLNAELPDGDVFPTAG